MARPLKLDVNATPPAETRPKTVQSAKVVNLALVAYTDEDGQQQVQLTVIGDNNVVLLNGQNFAFSDHRQPEGVAKAWLKDGIFKALEGTKVK